MYSDRNKIYCLGLKAAIKMQSLELWDKMTEKSEFVEELMH